MKTKELVSVIVAVGSVWLGGSIGAAALEKANAAPLACPSIAADPARPTKLTLPV